MMPNDYWAGAVKQCGGVSKLPTAEHLAKLAEELYLKSDGSKPSIGGEEYIENLTFQSDSQVAQALGLTPTFSLWSSVEDTDNDAYTRDFWSGGGTEWAYGSRSGAISAICIGD